MSAAPLTPPARGDTLDAMTVLLQAWKQGDGQAFARVAEALQNDFMRMAAARLKGNEAITLSQGEVVNEAWLRLMNSPQHWENRAHFFATASLTMRSVLREYARAKLADKRGGRPQQVPLSEAELGEESQAAELLNLDALLSQFSRQDPRAARVLELSYFTGLQRADIAEILDISIPTVDRELRFARAWLSERLEHTIGP
ncbi:RNA polymerase sigma factor (TIGR02999 family) [Paucibacter oligotrophus]|uniref:RNA polymerase sigma factor (TIGR02999 family) n=1 Tax=Roseateles oligotrophus TaxID=1769250 RepID=A0A840LAQ1_9BURK|nr:ECF-type sigma factor [Roseateles oligotrophus]MBB4843732.1 RNA polymerase sigma factor (TIGR02999 family) [Roseateles oligotrophus]